MRTSQVQIVMASHVNGARRLFGGKLMEWIDITAAVEARRHALCDVTLAAVDPLEFIEPVHVNDTVVLEAEVTWTGRTSLEVKVDTFVEHLTNVRQHVNRAYLVFVAVDAQNNPQEIQPYQPQTEMQKREFENAAQRRAYRLKLRQETQVLMKQTTAAYESDTSYQAGSEL